MTSGFHPFAIGEFPVQSLLGLPNSSFWPTPSAIYWRAVAVNKSNVSIKLRQLVGGQSRHRVPQETAGVMKKTPRVAVGPYIGRRQH